MQPTTRRRMLAMLLGGTGLGAILYKARGRLRSLVTSSGMGPPPSKAPGSPLASELVPTLVALGDTLIPTAYSSSGSQNRSAPALTALQQALEEGSLRTRTFHDDCETAARLLDRIAQEEKGRDFSALDFAERQVLVGTLLDPAQGSRSVWQRLAGASAGQDSEAVKRVASALIRAFYLSRYGWMSMGYSHGRGECTDLEDYQFAPHPDLPA